MNRAIRVAIRFGVLGFALGLILSLVVRARAEVALSRAICVALILAATTFVASSLNRQPDRADEDVNRSTTSAD